jgi:hypothetical protein
MTTRDDLAQWLPMRAGGKQWGRLHRTTLVFEVGRGDWRFEFDIVASAREGRPVVRRRQCGDPIDDDSTHVL